MAHKMSAARSGKKSSVKDGGLERMVIEPAENGFTAKHHKKPVAKAGRGPAQMISPYQEPESHVFGSADELGQHVAQTFGGGKGKPQPSDNDADD